MEAIYILVLLINTPWTRCTSSTPHHYDKSTAVQSPQQSLAMTSRLGVALHLIVFAALQLLQHGQAAAAVVPLSASATFPCKQAGQFFDISSLECSPCDQVT